MDLTWCADLAAAPLVLPLVAGVGDEGESGGAPLGVAYDLGIKAGLWVSLLVFSS